MNKQIRRFLPFKLNTHEITQDMIDNIADILNNMPRKILGFMTPLEVHGLQNQEMGRSRAKLAAPAMEAIRVYNVKESNVALRY